MKELIIDRFEDTYVVCHTPSGSLDTMRRNRLPEHAEVGSWLVIDDDGNITIDIEKTLRNGAAKMYRLKNMLKKRKGEY